MSYLGRFGFFFLVAFVQCKEPYQFSTLDQNGLLVVDGSINDGPGPYLLTLGTTDSENLPTQLPVPLLGADVTISDNYGNSERYVEMGKGTYQLPGTIVKGTPGRSYTLNIYLPKLNKSYTSSAEWMPSVQKPQDSIFLKIETTKTVTNNVAIANWYVDVFMNTTFKSDSGYFRWAVDEVYFVVTTCPPGDPFCPSNCYVFAPYSSYNLTVVDRKDYSGTSLQNILLYHRGVDFSFDTRHYFNVTQFAINNSAYAYWKAVQKLISNTGTIFNTPPYTIRGNVRNVENENEIVLGYFEASAQRLTRKFVDRGYIPTFIQSCYYFSPDYLPNFDYCGNCAILPGSTYTIPSWFW